MDSRYTSLFRRIGALLKEVRDDADNPDVLEKEVVSRSLHGPAKIQLVRFPCTKDV